jgi:hypothetical protein
MSRRGIWGRWALCPDDLPFPFPFSLALDDHQLKRLGSLAGRMGTLSMDKQEKLEKDAEKAEKKAEKKAEAEQKQKEVSPSPRSEPSISLTGRLQK